MPASITKTYFNGHSMTGTLQRVLVCSPRAGGWNRLDYAASWRELGFRHAPNFEIAQAQHEQMCEELREAGAEVIELEFSSALSLDAVYAHDASLSTDFGVILMGMGKANRIQEAARHAAFCGLSGIPVSAQIVAPATAEAGDIVWLDSKTLLIGRGYRTNAAGIEQMREILGPKGIEIRSAPLPHGAGPSECLHLMSLMSLLDDKIALVDLPSLAVETVELLKLRGFVFIEIDESERPTLACNVLALGGRRLLALEENRKTNARLRQAGFDVRTFAGSELCLNGGGGSTCLTRPLLRG